MYRLNLQVACFLACVVGGDAALVELQGVVCERERGVEMSGRYAFGDRDRRPSLDEEVEYAVDEGFVVRYDHRVEFSAGLFFFGAHSLAEFYQTLLNCAAFADRLSQFSCKICDSGEMPERSNVAVSKTVVRAYGPRVRIPLSRQSIRPDLQTLYDLIRTNY